MLDGRGLCMLRGVNLDSRSLRFALRDGAKSLGQLRRDPDREWPPEKVLQLALSHPDQFLMTTVVEEDKHQHPAIELGSELEPDAKTFIAAVRTSGKAGITNVKLWRTFKVKSERSATLAGEFPDLVTAKQKGLKTYYFWKPKLAKSAESAELADPKLMESVNLPVSAEPETASGRTEPAQERVSGPDGPTMPSEAPSGLESAPSGLSKVASPIGAPTEKQRDRLLELCRDGTRSDQYLSEFGYDRELLVSIVKRWPELFHAEVVQLSNDPSGAFLNVSLKRPPTLPEGERQSQPVEPTQGLQVPLAELVGPEQLAELKFKPASPDMARSRNDPRFAKGGIQRRRKPLVEI